MKKSVLLLVLPLILASCNGADDPGKHDHIDKNKDHVCDVCNNKISECVDNNHNHLCDICQKKMSEHADNDYNHHCDICGIEMSQHTDLDPKDHYCDVCETEISQCIDLDPKDHYCDICGKELSVCIDSDNNHLCDICGKTLSSCKDNDNDHLCDICHKKLTDCNDNDYNHLCDICGEKLSDCKDADNDHHCDACGAKLTECKDADNDHHCDACGAKLTECKDADNDHYCDVCGAKLTECKDEDNDHYCDVCHEKLTNCVDSDKDHNCDICGEKISECKDDNHDHYCDVCEKTLSECADKDGDYKCDYCGQDIPHITISINGPDTVYVGSTTQILSEVHAYGGFSNKVSWTVSNNCATISNNGVLTAISPGNVTISLTSDADKSVHDSIMIDVLPQSPVVKDWDGNTKQMMLDTIGQVFPYFEGNFIWNDDQFESLQSIFAYSTNQTDYQKAVDKLDELGCQKFTTIMPYAYGLTSDFGDEYRLIVSIDVHNFLDFGKCSVVQVRLAEMAPWPEGELREILDDFTQVELPSTFGDYFNVYIEKNYPDTEYYGSLLIGYGKYEDYHETLLSNGFEYSFENNIHCFTKHNLLITIDVSLNAMIVRLFRTNEVFTEWPAEEIAFAFKGKSSVTLLEANGTQFQVFKAVKSLNFAGIKVVGGDIDEYVNSLQIAGYNVNAAETAYLAIYGDLILEIVQDSDSYWIYCRQNKTSDVWPGEEIEELMEGHPFAELPASTGSSFEILSANANYYASIIVYGENIGDYVGILLENGFDVVNETSYYLVTKGEFKAYLFDYGYYYSISLVNVSSSTQEWPGEQINAIVEKYSDETLIPCEGTNYIYAEYFDSEFFLVIEIDNADFNNYVLNLEYAGYLITEYTDYIVASIGDLEVVVYRPDENFAVSIGVKLIDALEKWPTEYIDSIFLKHVSEIIPSADGSGFEVYLVDQDPYFVEIMVREPYDFDYINTLIENNFVIEENYNYSNAYIAYKGDLCLDLYYEGAFLYIDARVIENSPLYLSWPDSEISEILSGVVDTSIPSANGAGYYIYEGDGTNVLAEIVVLNGDTDDYISQLESNGFEVSLDSSQLFYLATKDDVKVEIFEGINCIYLDISPIITYDEWPSNLIDEIFGNITDVIVPELVGENFSVEYQGYGIIEIKAQSIDITKFLSDCYANGFAYESYNFLSIECYDIYKDNIQIYIQIDQSENIATIYIEEITPLNDEWPSDDLEFILDGYITTEIPEAEGQYFIVDDSFFEDYGSIDLTVLNANVDGYFEALEKAGFEFVYYDEDLYATKGDVDIKITEENYNMKLEISKVTIISSIWPAEEIYNILKPHTDVTLPELDGSVFEIYQGPSYVFMQMFILDTTVDSAVLIFENAGFEYDASYEMLSKGNLKVFVSEYDDDIIYLYFVCLDEFPSASVEELLSDMPGGSETTIPAFEALQYSISYSSTGFDINGSILTDDTYLVYFDELENEGWTLLIDSSSTDKTFVSPNGQIKLRVYLDESDGFLLVLQVRSN